MEDGGEDDHHHADGVDAVVHAQPEGFELEPFEFELVAARVPVELQREVGDDEPGRERDGDAPGLAGVTIGQQRRHERADGGD